MERGSLSFPKHPLLPFKTRIRPSGFTLVEILVATSLLAIVSSMAAVVMVVSNRATVNTTAMANAMAAIDNDISRIKEVSERFTCCSGVCTSDPAAIAAAATTGLCTGSVGDSAYYFVQDPAVNTTQATDFATACNSGLTTNLIGQIPASTLPTGITRTVVDDGVATARRIRVTYAATNPTINRVVKIVPSVASWCP